MSILFTDPHLYLKGTSVATLKDKSTGNIVYWSNKFQTANVTASVTLGEIRAGIGNAISAMIPTDAAFQVNFTAADFSLYAKAAQAGATLEYGAPVMVCQTVTAASAEISISVASGTPVPELGTSVVRCYVQEIVAASPITSGGIAYQLNPTTGAVTGFTATSGKEYVVWYCVNQAGAQLATVNTNLDPKVLHFSAEMAVYSSTGGASNVGTRVGTLHVIVPNLKLSGEGSGVTGDQTTPDTSSISGQAIAYDVETISDTCATCGGGGSVLAYYLYVPCDQASSIKALALPGGVISMKKSTSHTIHDFYLVMEDNSLASVDNALATYTLTTPPSGTAVAGAVITAGATTGECDISASVTVDGKTVTCTGTLSVTD